MQRQKDLRKNRKAASPAVSMVIITAATIALVLVSSGYALQVLMRQQAAAEFETVQNSLIAFDDALRDIAWDRSGSRSIRFTTNYGNMRLIDAAKSFEIKASGINDEGAFNYPFSTAVVKYQMPYGYGAAPTDSPYLLGNESSVISSLTDSLCQAVVEQTSESMSIALNYRVRVSAEGAIDIISPSKTTVNYFDIYVVRLQCVSSAINSSDFDLVCKNIGLQTIPFGMYTVNAPNPCIMVGQDPVYLSLGIGANVVFNLIIADVRVST